MAFSFEIPKPADIEKTVVSTREKIISGGGMFSGDSKTGRFSGRGVEGIYHAGNNSIKITVIRKPALYPVSAVKSAIEDYFRE